MVCLGGAELRKLEGPVLLTGHTGFKGSWMTQYLKALGIEVVGFSLPATEQSLYMRANLSGLIREEFGNILELSKFKKFVETTKPSAILHFAAQSLVKESYKNPVETFSTNVMGTVNILEVARQYDSVKAVAIVTTDKVYENRNLKRKFTEGDAIFGNDPYSASKAAAENAVAAWRSLRSEDETPYISVLRAGNVIGGGDFSENRLLPDVVRAKISRKEMIVRNPASTRPWQHVLDPLDGYLSSLERSIRDQTELTLNFGPRENSLTVQEVIEIAKGKWPDLKVRIDNQVAGNHEAKFLDLDSSDAQRILNWQPRFNQQEAINRTLAWWDQVLEKPAFAKDITNAEIHEFIAMGNS
jgi:CDP-glucose 4,6-dehydratase